MNRPPHAADLGIQIRTPCSKQWSELIGDDRRRFCSACSLHVHNATQLTRAEATELITSGESRVCLRVEYDASGAPLFREPAPAGARAGVSWNRAARAGRWALSAFAGLLAACNGGVQSSAPENGGAPNGGVPASRLGQVLTTEKVGDFAAPQPPRIERLGEVAPAPEPASLPPLDAPVRPGGR
jgi:hypothetical protein